jgi:predicted amidophosphoribosyltransferase
MPAVSELTAVYGNFLLSPRHGPGVCEVCFNLTAGYRHCYACARSRQWLAAVAPISYSVGHEQLHHVLAGYKRLPGEVAHKFEVELAAVLWRYLGGHERCVAAASGVTGFDLVTAVPSGSRERDDRHPLHRIVGQLVGPTRDRYQRLLRRSDVEITPRLISEDKFEPAKELSGETILLVDDTWTSGASAQSAAAALVHAGAGPVAAVVIGRHLNREWHHNDERLRQLVRPFDWEVCAHEPLASLQRRAS